MKYFVVEGTIINQEKMNDNIMIEHKEYTQKAMDAGLILMAGLKGNMSGGMFIMKAESLQEIKDYLDLEPFNISGIQDYRVTEVLVHYYNDGASEWFKK